MLLGSNVFPKTDDPEEYAELLARKGYRAGYYPEGRYSSRQTEALGRMRRAFEKRGLIIAEVGAWHQNPLHPDPETARKSAKKVVDWLAVAEEVGARCCVNIIGSAAQGMVTPENYSKDFYARVVDVTRHIVDQVNPKHTKMTYEILPFNFLDGADSYEQLLRDVDRPGFAVHLDPINCIISSRGYHNSAAEFRYAIKKLAPYGIMSMHLKDLVMRPDFPNIHLDEVPLGTGGLDIAALLRAADSLLPRDTPLMLEHLKSEEEYDRATGVARGIAAQNGIAL